MNVGFPGFTIGFARLLHSALANAGQSSKADRYGKAGKGPCQTSCNKCAEKGDFLLRRNGRTVECPSWFFAASGDAGTGRTLARAGARFIRGSSIIVGIVLRL